MSVLIAFLVCFTLSVNPEELNYDFAVADKTGKIIYTGTKEDFIAGCDLRQENCSIVWQLYGKQI